MYERKLGKLSLTLTRKEWLKILHWFLHGLPVVAIAQETGLHRQRILRDLTYVRIAFQKDIREVFSGTVEVDETYLGGHWKNKRHSVKAGGTKRGRGTSKTHVFGILCRGGKVWVQVVPDVEAKTLLSLISRRVETGSTVCSDTWRSYTGIAANGYVHHLVKHHKGEYSGGKGNHINGLEGFWGYLKRRLVAKSGIRKERLPLYLAEYVCRYNHRNINIQLHKKLILKQLERKHI